MINNVSRDRNLVWKADCVQTMRHYLPRRGGGFCSRDLHARCNYHATLVPSESFLVVTKSRLLFLTQHLAARHRLHSYWQMQAV